MGTTGTIQRRFFQTSLLVLMILFGFSAAALWSWRLYTNSNRAETAADLIRQLDSGRLEERRYAAQRLVLAATSESESVIAALLQSLADPSADVRADAVSSLGAYLASAISRRGQALLNSAIGVANLDRVGETLLDSLAKDDDPEVRVSAAWVLASLRNKLDTVSGSEMTSSRPASLARGKLVAAFDAALRRDPANRRRLLQSLSLVGHRSLAAPPALLEELDHPDAVIRAQAVMAVSGFGSGVDAALAVVLRDLEDRQSMFRNENEDDLGTERSFTSRDYWSGIRKMHLSPAVVPRLREALGSRDPPVVRCAVILLGNIGPQARAAIPTLIQALKNAGTVEPSDNLTGNNPTLDIALTIAKVVPPDEAVAVLTGNLRSPISSTRDAAATALVSLGPKAHAAIPVLAATLREIAASKDKSKSGGIIAHALAEVAALAPEPGRTDPEAISALGDALKSGNRTTSFSVVYALRRLGPRAAPAIPALRALTAKSIGDSQHSAVEIRHAIDFALERIEGEQHPAEKINR